MKLGRVINKWRLMSELTLRQAAKQIGIPHCTLMRLEMGHSPRAETLREVLAWLLAEWK